MACTAMAACLRLIALYIERTINEGEAFTSRIGLRDVLTEENVQVVMKLGLLGEYDVDRQIVLLNQTNLDLDRAQEMLRAWLAPRGEEMTQ